MFVSDICKVEGSTDGDCGRYVVAQDNLETNTEVLNEKPVVLGPKQNSTPVCIECCSTALGQQYACSRCNLPLCDKCNAGDLHLHEAECDVFVQNGIKFSEAEVNKVYPCITVLRILLAGVGQLQSHVQEREDTPVWVYNVKTVVPFILSLRDENGNTRFTEAEVHEATGALDTNSFQVQGDQVLARAVFQSASFFNNSCAPNCYREVTRNGISIKTSRPVKKGEELTICYTGLLTPNHIRQAVFKQTKHFECRCQRCCDPTERGTHPTAVLCTECHANVVDLACIACGEEDDQSRIDQVRLLCDTLVSRMVKEDDCDILASGLMKLRRMLSKHHFLLVKLKLHLINHADKCEACQASEPVRMCISEMKELVDMLNIGQQDINSQAIRQCHENLNTWKLFLAEKM